jgi:hypothetical protein
VQIFNKTVQALTQFSGNSGSELTNINEKACNNIPARGLMFLKDKYA